MIDKFGNPPKLPKNTINILDDYATYEAFVKGAIDWNSRARMYDSEIKYIFNFLKNHINKGDEFIIETSNIFKSCNSCQRELVTLKKLAETQGKKITIIVKSDKSIESTDDLLKALRIKNLKKK